MLNTIMVHYNFMSELYYIIRKEINIICESYNIYYCMYLNPSKVDHIVPTLSIIIYNSDKIIKDLDPLNIVIVII